MRNQPDPEPRDRRLRHHGELLETRSTQGIVDGDARTCKPLGPPRRARALLEKSRPRQIGRVRNPLAVSRTANGYAFLTHEELAHGTRPMRLAKMNGGVEWFGGKIERHKPDAEIDRHVRVACEKCWNAGNEPTGPESRQNRQVEHPACPRQRDGLPRGIRQVAEGLADLRSVHAAHIRQDHPLARAAEQGQSERILQLLDLARDGALGEIELIGRARDGAMARRGLKGQKIAHIGKKAATKHQFIPFKNNLLRRCRYTMPVSRASLRAKFDVAASPRGRPQLEEGSTSCQVRTRTLQSSNGKTRS